MIFNEKWLFHRLQYVLNMKTFKIIISRSKWLFHPIFIFVFSTVALAVSFFLYIYWYMEASTRLNALIKRFNLDPGQFLEAQTWMVILVLSILVAIILVGIFTIFVYNQKTLQLYRLQHNFINSFTHELKTPVTSLKLFLETFTKHELSRSDQLKYITYMISDVNRLSNHINRILNLARIESKSYGSEFIVTDLVSLTKQFYENNVHLFQDSEISIHNTSEHKIFYSISKPLYEMLLMNILTNAIQYNKSEKPKVKIRFDVLNNKLYINFTDNGIGLEKPKIKKIFRKFYQIGRSDNMSAKGSGLGLHLVQNVARLHKGKVVAQSGGKDKGSVFSFILPYKH